MKYHVLVHQPFCTLSCDLSRRETVATKLDSQHGHNKQARDFVSQADTKLLALFVHANSVCQECCA